MQEGEGPLQLHTVPGENYNVCIPNDSPEIAASWFPLKFLRVMASCASYTGWDFPCLPLESLNLYACFIYKGNGHQTGFKWWHDCLTRPVLRLAHGTFQLLCYWRECFIKFGHLVRVSKCQKAVSTLVLYCKVTFLSGNLAIPVAGIWASEKRATSGSAPGEQRFGDGNKEVFFGTKDHVGLVRKRYRIA